MSNIAIIGAGLAGAVLARELAEQGNNIDIYDKNSFVAGNLYDKKINGINVHMFGPHIFHTSDEEVIDFVTKYADFNEFNMGATSMIENHDVPLPFDFNFLDIFFENKDDIKERLINEFGERRVLMSELMESKDPEIQNFRDFMFEKGYQNYISKMWGIPHGEIDKKVIDRLPFYTGYKSEYFDDKFEGIPVDGYSSFIKKILNHNNVNVILNEKIKIVFKNKKAHIKNRGNYDKIFYTGMIDELFDFKFGKLPYRSISFEFKEMDIESYQPLVMRSYPNDKSITRTIEHKKFTNLKSKHTVLTIETPGEYDERSERFNIPMYPIANKETDNVYNDYLKELQSIENIYVAGRLGMYKYMNMDEVIKSSLKIARGESC